MKKFAAQRLRNTAVETEFVSSMMTDNQNVEKEEWQKIFLLVSPTHAVCGLLPYAFILIWEQDVAHGNYSALLGVLLNHYRTQRQLSQAETAAAIGISESLYSKIECGKHIPRHLVLRRLAELLPMDSHIPPLLETLRSRAKGYLEEDAGLPDEIQALILEIRQAADSIPDTYVRALRKEIREVVS